MATHPQWLKSLIKAEGLPSDFESLALDFYLPLAKSIVSWAQHEENGPLVVGVNGAQGTGKSTLSMVLALALEHEHQLKCAIISIDDIYLTLQERADLSESIHPLLKTRGVPGTHDTSMGIDLIQQLKNKKPVMLPVFNKAIDDRAPEEKWSSCDTAVDIILFEGWCVGALAQQPQELADPCNYLEESEDQDAAWRTYANQQLAGPYSELFGLINRLVMLKAPDFECVYQWRSKQEEKLRQLTADLGLHSNSIMNDEQIKRFIMHYERLTRWMFEEMPDRADCVLELNHDHHIVRASYTQT
ncbi:MAG: D-glycerate 3-kinase [Cryomorphaceae bacterium]|jgi:D-glycerate 3-kinase